MLPNNLYLIPQREPLIRIIRNRRSCASLREFPEQGGRVFDWANEDGDTSIGALAFSMAISTDNVVFDHEPLKVDRLWAVVATHPSGQQEHIVGFHTEAGAREWRASHSCEAWLRTRGYTGWRLRELGRSDAAISSIHTVDAGTNMRLIGSLIEIETLDTPAWRSLSHGAQMLYVALKRRYNRNSRNNGRIFLSQRFAAKELRSSHNRVARWYRELRHYGFIVKHSEGYLGVDGKACAPPWRLTELGYMHEPPTKEYLSWNGRPFEDRKTDPRTSQFSDL